MQGLQGRVSGKRRYGHIQGRVSGALLRTPRVPLASASVRPYRLVGSACRTGASARERADSHSSPHETATVGGEDRSSATTAALRARDVPALDGAPSGAFRWYSRDRVVRHV